MLNPFEPPLWVFIYFYSQLDEVLTLYHTRMDSSTSFAYSWQMFVLSALPNSCSISLDSVKTEFFVLT